jgi:hypothetical protein
MPHFQTNLKGHRLYPYIKRTANWRLVTIDLSVYYQFFERAIYEQLSHYFENIFQPFLSAFRPGFGCNTALLKLLKIGKKPLIVISIQLQCLKKNSLRRTQIDAFCCILDIKSV